MRERFADGQERSFESFSSPNSASSTLSAQGFDESWQQLALSSGLEQVPFLKNSATRQQVLERRTRGES